LLKKEEIIRKMKKFNFVFFLGLLLFFITLVLNILSQRIVRRFREVYE